MTLGFKKRPLFLKKWPRRSQWRRFFEVMGKREKIVFLIFSFLFWVSLISLLSSLYLKNTEAVPASGGTYIEGLVGQPRFINPVYANSDVDRDLVELIFSGLMKHNGKLEIAPGLAQRYEVDQDQKIYTFYLKENLRWQDKIPLTADDIIFTIRTIQDPDYKSPFRANWVGVEVEKINDLAVRFKLKKPYAGFLENCSLKILPRHIWKDISPENFPLDSYNLNPIGSGPYKLAKTKGKPNEIESLTLARNSYYHGKKPNIKEIKLLFFENEEELVKKAGKVQGLSLTSSQYLNKLVKKRQAYYISLPRYFALFFNQEESKVLAEEEVRKALNYGTNKEEIVQKILGEGNNSSVLEKAVVDSPILPKIYGFEPPSEIYDFDIEKAKEILDKFGFKEKEQGPRVKTTKKSPAFQFKSKLQTGSRGNEVTELQKCLAQFPEIYPEGKITGYFGNDTKKAIIRFQEKYKKEILDPWGYTKGTGSVGSSTRAKLNEICFPQKLEGLALQFSLITVDQPQMVELAELLKSQWQALGAEVDIEKYPASQLEQDFIKPRKYQILLFGEVLGAIPDPLPFWHSSQNKDPGLNLALYQNSKADKLLEEIRTSSDPEARAEKINEFQDILIADAPAVFLYSPDYLYLVSNKIKGINLKTIIDPSKRFSQVEDWYLKTSREWK